MRLLLPAMTLLAACSVVPSTPDPDAGPLDAPRPCEPRACGALECGDLDDGCGGPLRCGCPDGTICGFATPNVCGGECASDAECALGTFCDLGRAACTDGCRTGPHLAVDIPLTRVALDLTLDGAPLPSLRAGERSPRLIFYPAGEPSLGAAVDLYDLATSAEPKRPVVSLAPGAFDVVLQTGDMAEPWPAGRRHPLGAVVVAQDTVSVPIDVVTHEVTLRFSMDGAPIPDDFGAGTPALQLVRPYGYLPEVVLPLADGGPVRERTLRVVDQTVAVTFDRGDASPATWPTSGTVIDALDLRGSSIVDIDIPRERVTVTLTRDGAPPPDGVELVLHDTTAEPHYDVDHALGPLVGGIASAWVLSGRYELRSIAGPSDWPPGIWTLAELAVEGDTTVDLDARPVLVHVSARLDTELPSDCNRDGTVELAGARLALGSGGASEETDAWVFPGTYSPVYHPPVSATCPRDGVWPASLAALPSVEIVDASPITLVVRRARATFRARVDGSPPRPIAFSVEEGDESPSLEIGYADGRITGDVIPLLLYGFDGAALQPVEPAVTLVPQTYWIGYRRYGEGPSDQWPPGTRAIDDAFVLESDAVVPIELETIPIRVDVTLNGGPLPESPGDSWGGGGWPTGIELSSPRSLVRLHPWSAGGTLELRVFSERYDVLYGLPFGFTVHAEGPLPPPELRLGCWEP